MNDKHQEVAWFLYNMMIDADFLLIALSMSQVYKIEITDDQVINWIHTHESNQTKTSTNAHPSDSIASEAAVSDNEAGTSSGNMQSIQSL